MIGRENHQRVVTKAELVECIQHLANAIVDHEQSTVVSAMLSEPYLAALLSLVLLIATLI